MALRSPRLFHWVLLSALTVLWGSAFAATDIALKSFSPVSIVAGRVLIAGLMLAVAVRLAGRKMPSGAQQWRWVLAMAILGNAVPFYLIAWGQQQVDSNVAGILMAVMPLMVIALAHRLVPGERIDARRLGGMLAGLAGVVLLLGGGGALPWSGEGSFTGRLAILAGAMCYGVNIILARLAPRMDSMGTAAGVTLIAAMLVVPMALLSASPTVNVDTSAVVAVILLGVFATGLATVIYFEIVRQAGPVFLSLINYLVPAWAVLIGTLVLGERLQLASLLALVVIAGGVWLSQSRGNRPRNGIRPAVAAAGRD